MFPSLSLFPPSLSLLEKSTQTSMAEEANRVENNTEEEEEEEEKWVKYYASFHEILLVGEGDFSFSTSLAQAFGSGSNIVASSLDSYDDVIKKYKKAKSNFSILEKLGASHLHGVDATKMKLHSNLNMRKFDRIIFNFPHAGFLGKEDDSHLIGLHRTLLYGFFKNASGMLWPNGEVHVNHKIAHPYCKWNLEELANRNSLGLIERVAFSKEDYPGYENKRGSGSRCDELFILGECCTFKFNFNPRAKVNAVMKKLNRLLEPPKAPNTIFQLQQPSPFEFRHPPLNFTRFTNDIPGLNISYVHGLALGGRSHELPQAPLYVPQQRNHLEYGRTLYNFGPPIGSVPGFIGHPPSNLVPPMSTIPRCIGSQIAGTTVECLRIFGGYFEHVAKALASPDQNSSYFLQEAIKLGYERYMAGEPGRTLSGYINMLEKLRNMCIVRQELQMQASIKHVPPSDSRSGTFQ